MLRKIKLIIIACKIEWHWKFITPGRKKANYIIENLIQNDQLPFNYPKLAELYHRINRHCTKVSVLTQKYKELAGII